MRAISKEIPGFFRHVENASFTTLPMTNQKMLIVATKLNFPQRNSRRRRWEGKYSYNDPCLNKTVEGWYEPTFTIRPEMQ